MRHAPPQHRGAGKSTLFLRRIARLD
jgi:hypothetical protein